MSKDARTVTQIEAERRIRKAQDILEFRVQAGLNAVREELSRIIWCPEWEIVGKEYDRVKALWYKLNDRSLSSKIDLDSEEAPRFVAELAKAQKSAGSTP
jgi:hypothetical protein